MTLRERLFGRKAQALEMEHPTFGKLVFSKRDGWQNLHFNFWDNPDIELLIDAGPNGPTAEQEATFARLRDAKREILPRCLRAVSETAREMESPAYQFKITGLSIPAFDAKKAGHLWTLWFDGVGDDHFWYGVQTEDDWKTIAAFADD